VVMEFLKGGSLDVLLKKRLKRTKPLSSKEMIRLSFGIASGMVHLHAGPLLPRSSLLMDLLILLSQRKSCTEI
jgi:serine/threonine protein kinase